MPDPTPRQFTSLAVQSAVDKVLAGLPANVNGAVVAHADTAGVRLSVVGRLGDQWTVVAEAYKPFKGPLVADAEVRFTW